MSLISARESIKSAENIQYSIGMHVRNTKTIEKVEETKQQYQDRRNRSVITELESKLVDGCSRSDHEALLGWEHSPTVLSLCARLTDDGIPPCIFVVHRRVQRFCGMAVSSCYPRRPLLIGTTTSEKLLLLTTGLAKRVLSPMEIRGWTPPKPT